VLQTWRTDAVRWLWLAHLSRTNNSRKIALSSMQQHITEASASLELLHITALPHDGLVTWDSAHLWHDEKMWKM